MTREDYLVLRKLRAEQGADAFQKIVSEMPRAERMALMAYALEDLDKQVTAWCEHLHQMHDAHLDAKMTKDEASKAEVTHLMARLRAGVPPPGGPA